MSSHSPNRKLDLREQKSRSSVRNRKDDSPSSRQSETRDYHSRSRRRSRSSTTGHSVSPEKKSPKINEICPGPSSHTGNNERLSSSRQRSEHRSPSPERFHDDKSDSKGDRPVFRGPDSDAPKYDTRELKKITVKITRTLPEREKPVIQRTILNPETITPVRRPDEGTRPIFARPELLVAKRDTTDEDRRVASRKSIENDTIKRERSESPKHGSSYRRSAHKHSERHYSPYEHRHRRSPSPDDKHRQSRRDHYDESRRRDRYESRSERSRDPESDKRLVPYEKGADRKRHGDSSKIRSPSPSTSRKGERARSREKEVERERRRSPERDKRLRRDSSRERYSSRSEPGDQLVNYEEFEETSRGRGRGRGGTRGGMPHRGMMRPPMMGYLPPRLPPPYMMIRPGFRPPPPYPHPGFFPRY